MHESLCAEGKGVLSSSFPLFLPFSFLCNFSLVPGGQSSLHFFLLLFCALSLFFPGPFSFIFSWTLFPPPSPSLTIQSEHAHTHTHLDANIRPTLCLCLRKRSCPAYQSVKATCEARSPAAGRNWLVLSLGDGKMNFPHKDRSTCTAEWPCSGFLVPSIKAVMEFYLRLFHNVFIKHRKRHGCHRSPLQCTAKGLCGVFFCSNFTV